MAFQLGKGTKRLVNGPNKVNKKRNGRNVEILTQIPQTSDRIQCTKRSADTFKKILQLSGRTMRYIRSAGTLQQTPLSDRIRCTKRFADTFKKASQLSGLTKRYIRFAGALQQTPFSDHNRCTKRFAGTLIQTLQLSGLNTVDTKVSDKQREGDNPTRKSELKNNTNKLVTSLSGLKQGGIEDINADNPGNLGLSINNKVINNPEGSIKNNTEKPGIMSYKDITKNDKTRTISDDSDETNNLHGLKTKTCRNNLPKNFEINNDIDNGHSQTYIDIKHDINRSLIVLETARKQKLASNSAEIYFGSQNARLNKAVHYSKLKLPITPLIQGLIDTFNIPSRITPLPKGVIRKSHRHQITPLTQGAIGDNKPEIVTQTDHVIINQGHTLPVQASISLREKNKQMITDQVSKLQIELIKRGLCRKAGIARHKTAEIIERVDWSHLMASIRENIPAHLTRDEPVNTPTKWRTNRNEHLKKSSHVLVLPKRSTLRNTPLKRHLHKQGCCTAQSRARHNNTRVQSTQSAHTKRMPGNSRHGLIKTMVTPYTRNQYKCITDKFDNKNDPPSYMMFKSKQDGGNELNPPKRRFNRTTDRVAYEQEWFRTNSNASEEQRHKHERHIDKLLKRRMQAEGFWVDTLDIVAPIEDSGCAELPRTHNSFAPSSKSCVKDGHSIVYTSPKRVNYINKFNKFKQNHQLINQNQLINQKQLININRVKTKLIEAEPAKIKTIKSKKKKNKPTKVKTKQKNKNNSIKSDKIDINNHILLLETNTLIIIIMNTNISEIITMECEDQGNHVDNQIESINQVAIINNPTNNLGYPTNNTEPINKNSELRIGDTTGKCITLSDQATLTDLENQGGKIESLNSISAKLHILTNSRIKYFQSGTTEIDSARRKQLAEEQERVIRSINAKLAIADHNLKAAKGYIAQHIVNANTCEYNPNDNGVIECSQSTITSVGSTELSTNSSGQSSQSSGDSPKIMEISLNSSNSSSAMPKTSTPNRDNYSEAVKRQPRKIMGPPMIIPKRLIGEDNVYPVIIQFKENRDSDADWAYIRSELIFEAEIIKRPLYRRDWMDLILLVKGHWDACKLIKSMRDKFVGAKCKELEIEAIGFRTPLNPKVILKGIGIYKSSGETEQIWKGEVIKSLVNRNEFIKKAVEDNRAELRVIKILRSRDVVLQCTWNLYDQMLTKKLIIFHQSIIAEKYIDTHQCYNCLGFQHYSSECKTRGTRGKTCAKCGEVGHAYDKCTNRKIECCNCVKTPGSPVNHWATSIDCPRVQQANTEYLRRTIRYPKDMPESFFIKNRQLPNRMSKRKDEAEPTNSPIKKTKRSYDDLDGSAVKVKTYTKINHGLNISTTTNPVENSMEVCDNQQQQSNVTKKDSSINKGHNTTMNDSGTASASNIITNNPTNIQGLSNANISNVSLNSSDISDAYNDAQTPSQVLNNDDNMQNFCSIRDSEGNEIKVLNGRIQKMNAIELIKKNNAILYKDEFDRQFIVEENYRVYLDDQITREDITSQELSPEKVELIEKIMNPQLNDSIEEENNRSRSSLSKTSLSSIEKSNDALNNETLSDDASNDSSSTNKRSTRIRPARSIKSLFSRRSSTKSNKKT